MAEVLGCGHASQLFDVDYLDGAPQVHLHFMTDEEEYTSLGFGRMEICCHGCGQSLLVLYDKNRSRRQHLTLRNRFKRRHANCKNHGFETQCPNYRSGFEVLDVRRSPEYVGHPSRSRNVEERLR